VPHVEQEVRTLPDHMSSPPVFSGVCVTRSLVFWVMFCRSLFVLLTFFFRPLYCLYFDLRLLITLLVSSNSRPLCCLSYDLRLLITLLVYSNSRPLCCLSYDLRLLITLLVSPNSRPLCCLSYDLRLLITSVVSSNSRPLCCLSYDLRLLITTLLSSIFSWYSEYHHLYIFFICDVYYTYFFLYYLTILGRVYKTM
jgi:hypothetical protein